MSAIDPVSPSPSQSTLGGLGTARIEAFSDAIIAIAATLLVIELAVPAPGEDVWHAVGEELPSIAAFAVSFVTILIFWVNHHALFALVHHVDRALLFLNGLLLLGITAIGFPTAVLGRALQAGVYDRSAAVLYTLALALPSGTFVAIWAYLRARPHLLEPHARTSAGSAVCRSLVGPTLYLLALAIGLVSAPAALVVVALVALYFALPPRRVHRGAS